MIGRCILLATLTASASAFTLPSASISTGCKGSCFSVSKHSHDFESVSSVGRFDPLKLSDETPAMSPSKAAITAITAALVSSPLAANAAGPDWGIFEGRTGSLLHPIAMFGMAAMSASTALLGFQWRRQRTLGDEISALKKSLPDLSGASSVSDALAAAQSAESVDSAYVAKLKAALPIESEINALTKERKDLASSGPRDKHFNQGSILLFIGIAFAIEGPLNTYARAGKLFPGPHLYAGAGLVVLWALAASMVPAMQKGNDTARTVHIGANLAGMGLFIWQITSGIPILLKVIEFTKWP
ncbi:hypothetical protein HJC23_007233 [Cyclotella cryptica]|uniref:DUF4079 domain-containing protein n=1 Tax=Cyclotella cryptica TaxID=29204 RepID=A0ABD3QQJ9_9STRA|eukprot:CCRYP_003499-RA/>CCRYP_003499-RA protein AED:0.01 eAED:0.01 QI:69/1/1/1/1/1/2/262/299